MISHAVCKQATSVYFSNKMVRQFMFIVFSHETKLFSYPIDLRQYGFIGDIRFDFTGLV